MRKQHRQGRVRRHAVRSDEGIHADGRPEQRSRAARQVGAVHRCHPHPV